jgi:hypothetical protein
MADEKSVDELVAETKESQDTLEAATAEVEAVAEEATPLEKAAETLEEEHKEDRRLSPMEENWIFYMYAGIPWHEAKKLDSVEERQFLLSRCWEMKVAREEEQERANKREQQMEDQMLGVQRELQEKMESMPTKDSS